MLQESDRPREIWPPLQCRRRYSGRPRSGRRYSVVAATVVALDLAAAPAFFGIKEINVQFINFNKKVR